MTKDDVSYLKHIQDAIERIEEYGGNMTFEEFRQNILVQDGILRRIQVIGEAVKHLSENILKTDPNTPWKGWAGIRDKIIHHYFGIDIEIVWDTIQIDLPALKKAILSLLEKMEEKNPS